VELLWSPWRNAYVTGEVNTSQGDGCVFCRVVNDPLHDENNLVLHRGGNAFVILNLYPYISGHLMIVSNAHLNEFDAAPKQTTDEMMDLAKRAQSVLREVYHPQGFNLGMNLGKAAGAGIADHIHLHLIPRWAGDTNFMTSLADTRVISEELSTTYRKLREKF
jgi:ATP adenylyltransferase